MTIIEDPEDEAWAELEAQQQARKAQDDWVCPFCYTKGCPTPKECRELALRNQVIEEIAQHIEQFHVVECVTATLPWHLCGQSHS